MTPESPTESTSSTADPGPRPGTTEGGDPHAPSPASPALSAEPTAGLLPEVERLAPCEGGAATLRDPSLPRASGIFFFVVSVVTIALDLGSKVWAERALEPFGEKVIVPEHLFFVLAKNRGGAWGMLQGTQESTRRPFFLIVSVFAIVFILHLYGKLHPSQRALKWGLPLVFGGAIGNVVDRLRYGHVIDFIDYRAEWVRKMNELLAKFAHGMYVTDHWPTFNIADVAIVVGVGLMAIDMFTAKRRTTLTVPQVAVAAPAADPSPASSAVEALGDGATASSGEPPLETEAANDGGAIGTKE